jgi:hypothetical protein
VRFQLSQPKTISALAAKMIHARLPPRHPSLSAIHIRKCGLDDGVLAEVGQIGSCLLMTARDPSHSVSCLPRASMRPSAGLTIADVEI